MLPKKKCNVDELSRKKGKKIPIREKTLFRTYTPEKKKGVLNESLSNKKEEKDKGRNWWTRRKRGQEA